MIVSWLERSQSSISLIWQRFSFALPVNGN
jgi:hypothetical protein